MYYVVLSLLTYFSRAFEKVWVPAALGMFEASHLSRLALTNPDTPFFLPHPTAAVRSVACHIASVVE